MFVHIVFFWLKPGTPESARQALIADCNAYLARIPGVKQLHAGPPANTPRAVVDNSYQVGLSVQLDSREDHDVYQDHPLHKEFIQRNQAHWQRVQVYDFVS